MTDDDLTIPDFLRRHGPPPPLPKGKRLRWTRDMTFKDKPTREEEAATKQLRREIEAAKKAKAKARLLALRERFGKR